MAQNLPGCLLRPTLQSGFKKLGGQKKSGTPYFQAYFWSRYKIPNEALESSQYNAIRSSYDQI